MPRFFVPSVAEDTITVTGQDASHIRRSLRMMVGETLTVCDGCGTDCLCEIQEFAGEDVLLRVLSRALSESEPTCAVTLYQGLPKADKMEWIIQKAVEIGVTRIVPVQMARSVAVINEKSAKKAARWQKIADEAAGQSGRGVLPVVEEPISFAVAAKRLAGENTVVCYECGGKPFAASAGRDTKALSLVVGPEGGIDAREIATLEEGGAVIATLGKRILRCETAPVAALSVLMAITGNME
ncbi:MAG: 16S rRNA (uracil(1498)-N(3))-methyltransferase [Ruminococcaceae bacterium]|nr:16S rRNA (uracil(1498)-N(3))-methyltransferase [Oscillospiraceae bacterium]